tara:strand:+ start:1540 stop:3105 length:1566 start_codon:yes stop_codon:yes gene_type:complete
MDETIDMTFELDTVTVADWQKTLASLQLYNWQRQAFANWLYSMPDAVEVNGKVFLRRRGTIAAVTGSGKTRVGIAACVHWALEHMKADKPYSILWVAPTVKLMEQTVRVLTSHGFHNVGRLGNGFKDISSQILVSTVQSARKLNRSNEGCLIVVDECHRMATDKNASIFKNNEHNAVLGLSATPDRADGLNVLKWTGPVKYKLGYAEAIAEGCIPDFHIRTVACPFNGIERQQYESMSKAIMIAGVKLEEAFGSGCNPITCPPCEEKDVWTALTSKRKRHCNSAESRRDLLRFLLEEHRGQKIAVFHESIPETEVMRRQAEADGHVTFIYHSQSSDGDIDFRRWSDYNAGVLFSVAALKEGIDVPDMDVVIMLSGTNDGRSRVQTVGRALRGEAAEIYLAYIPNTTDSRGWQQMMSDGNIPPQNITHWDYIHVPELDVHGQLRPRHEKILSMIPDGGNHNCPVCRRRFQTEFKADPANHQCVDFGLHDLSTITLDFDVIELTDDSDWDDTVYECPPSMLED